MIIRLKSFRACESGSVTTDWVVLVASLVMMAVLVLTAVTSGAVDLSNETGATISAISAG